MWELVEKVPEGHLLLPCLLQPNRQMALEIKDIRECLQLFSHILGDESLIQIIVVLVCLVVTCRLCGGPQKIIKKIKIKHWESNPEMARGIAE